MKNKKKVQLVSITRHVFLTMAILWEVASGSGCGNILSGSQNGLIKSPNYPRNYPRHADCSWTVVVPLGHKISLSFDEFRVEMSAGCKKDRLKVYDGASSAATLIGKHCGSAKPSAITSSGSKLHLQFRSNGALQFKGFQATYNSSLVCGGTYLGKQGSLTSPGYPGTNYPNEATCLYKVVVPSGYTIKLRFNDLKLEAAEADGTCYDDIQVFDGPTSQDAGLGKYCGHQQPFSIHSTSNVLLIRFKSDRTTRARGFKAVYTAQAIPTTKLMTTTPPTRPPKTCWSTEFRCDNGKCIKHQWQCDKENDCGDNSDERGCPCPTHQSKCRNGNCIDLAWKCNGVDDCGDNSDEQNCTKVVQSKGCSQSNGGCEHTCTQFLDNQRLSVRCSCQTGYRLQNDQKHCADIDECLDGPLQNGGCHQICENTPGSRRCLCHKGYFLSVNKVSCEDIDECANYNGGCTHDCVNTAASFYCQCRPGFQLQNDRKTCSDVNECAVNNGGCSHRCENLDGGYKCHCPRGYQMGKDNKTCTDVDECATGNGGCKYLCNNKQGSFECTCPPGYVQDYRNPNMCHDIDECMEGIPACFNCINTLGSYECSCDEPGFIANAKKTQCMNINECATNNGGCGKHRCIDSYGSYRCECLSAGYQLDPSTKKCKEIDECAKNNGRGDCDHFCTNTDGSYSCGCRDGYKLRSEKSCLDIDECAVGAHQCEHFCNNTDGSYICTCKKNSFIAPDGYSCTKTKNLPDCGLAPSVVEPTEDGWEAAEEVSWPWTALLHFSVFGDIEGCMGTLIDREWVITTSHCVSIGPNSMDPKHLKVELGVYRRSSHGSPPKLHSVKQIIIHSEFNAAFSKLTSNIALVQLAEPIVVTDNLRPICLPTRHEIKQILRPGIVRKGVVIGWGKTENHRVEGSLKQAQVNVVHYHHCTWAGRLFNATKMICAGYDTGSACMSDSGSPIMFPVTHPQAPRKWILGGILSWGVSTLPQGCHKNYGYSAYTKVGQQLNWIKNQMKKPN